MDALVTVIENRWTCLANTLKKHVWTLHNSFSLGWASTAGHTGFNKYLETGTGEERLKNILMEGSREGCIGNHLKTFPGFWKPVRVCVKLVNETIPSLEHFPSQ